MTLRVEWVGSGAIAGAIVLGFLAPFQTNVVVSIFGLVNALVLVLLGVVVLRRPEADLMAPRIMGAGALIAGIVLGVLLFGTPVVFGMTGNLDLAQLVELLVVYVPFFALQGEPYSVTVVLGTVLFWAGIVLLLSSVRKEGPPPSS